MHRRPVLTMTVSLAVVVVMVLATFIFDKQPKLGLDLQGGVSVNLQPVKDGKVDNKVSSASLDQSVEIIRRRVDALGVAEPEVSRQGNTILVQLPGAKDQKEVLAVVGSTARLEFRPVLSAVGQIPKGADRKKAEAQIKKLRAELKIPEGVTAAQILADEQAKTPATPTNPDGTPGTTTPDSPKGPFNQWGVDISSKSFADLYTTENQLNTQVTPIEDAKDDQEATFADEDGAVYRLGPVAVDGRAVKTASAGLSQTGEWQVNPVFRKGKDNIDKFNEIAGKCYSNAPECPDLGGGKGQLAIVLDGEILSAPTINTPSFSPDQISISGSFNQESAERLAVSLRYGSLPIQLKPQQAETVSPTLGKGALEAGIICGLIGLVLVLTYLMVYYRLLGLVTAIGTLVLGGMLWTVMSTLNATVTLAGVVGIVVSIGTSLDSNIIYFEVLKEDVINGMPFRTAADKSFNNAWSTILASDFASLIGAGVLYWLAIGPVRGFAFYLGAVTILDLLIVYFVLRPAVYWIAHSEWGHNPRLFGIPVSYGDDRDPDSGVGRRSKASRSAERLSTERSSVDSPPAGEGDSVDVASASGAKGGDA